MQLPISQQRLNRSGLRTHLAAINCGLDAGGCKQGAVHCNFKIEAVRQIVHCGRPATEFAERLGLCHGLRCGRAGGRLQRCALPRVVYQPLASENKALGHGPAHRRSGTKEMKMNG